MRGFSLIDETAYNAREQNPFGQRCRAYKYQELPRPNVFERKSPTLNPSPGAPGRGSPVCDCTPSHAGDDWLADFIVQTSYNEGTGCLVFYSFPSSGLGTHVFEALLRELRVSTR